MRVQAKFTGENGSMGYFHGCTYVLAVTFGGRAVRIAEIDKATGKNRHGTVVPYASMEAFLDNWCNVSKVAE